MIPGEFTTEGPFVAWQRFRGQPWGCIAEGTINDDFGGREWDVNVVPGHEVRDQMRAVKAANKIAAKSVGEGRDDLAAMAVLDTLDPTGQGITLTVWRNGLGWNGTKLKISIDRLLKDRLVEEATVAFSCGKGSRTGAGYRRRISDI